VEKQTFRGDLYHRLAEYNISIPALMDRKEDLVFLVGRFLAQVNRELGKRVRGPNAAAWELIHGYAWPGNARELRNQLRRAVLNCDDPDGMITPGNLGMISGPQCVSTHLEAAQGVGAKACWSDGGASPACLLCDAATKLLSTGADLPLKELTAHLISQIERSILLKVLVVARCNKAQAARMLHIDYKTLHKKLKEHSIASSMTLQEHCVEPRNLLMDGTQSHNAQGLEHFA
jgi:DNA-binding NtrC family response regulator